jgi:hypothetical protein
MKGKSILLCVILLIIETSCGSSYSITGDNDLQSIKSRSFCDDHPFWNLCNPSYRLDSWDRIDHDLRLYSTSELTNVKQKSRLEICEDIVRKYNETHIYEKHNYDCDDMTMDIWNQLKKEYINAKIGLGNITDDTDNLWESSHAWVIAEYEPDTWIALEGVGGYLVSREENPLYYTGWFFDSPLEYKKYRELVAQFKDEVDDFNQLVEEYTNSSLSGNERKIIEVIIDDQIKKRKELENKLIALSQGVKTSNLHLFENKT